MKMLIKNKYRSSLTILFLLLVMCSSAQYMQWGGTFGFLGDESIKIKAPEPGDTGLDFDGYQINGPFTMQNKKGTMPFFTEGYLHVCFRKTNYFGFNYKFSHQVNTKTGARTINGNKQATFVLNTHKFTFSAGKIFPLGKFNFILEGGAGLATHKIKKKDLKDYTVYGQEYYSVYLNYVNRKNLMPVVYLKPMIDFYSLQLGLRLEFLPETKLNKGQFFNAEVQPAVSVGYNFRTSLFKVKRIKSREFNSVQDDDLIMVNKVNFGRKIFNYGVNLGMMFLENSATPVLTPFYSSKTSQNVEFRLKERALLWSPNLVVMYHGAPFKKRKFVYVAGLNFSFGSKGYRGVIADKVQKELLYYSGVVNENSEKAQICLSAFEFQAGIGHRFVTGSRSYLEAVLICAPSVIKTNSQMSVALSKYYNFNNAILMGGMFLDYKISHYGMGLSIKRSITAPDGFGRVKNNLWMVSLSLTKDVRFRF